ncbi:MAG: hypothetical protein WCP10_15860 [Desulfuromonadales bacterium]
MTSKVKTAFSLLRLGVLTEGQEHILILPTPSKTKSVRLSELYKFYFAEKSPNWSGSRTAGEFNKQFENILAVIADHPAGDYERTSLVAGREKLSESLAPKTVNKYLSLLSSVM